MDEELLDLLVVRQTDGDGDNAATQAPETALQLLISPGAAQSSSSYSGWPSAPAVVVGGAAVDAAQGGGAGVLGDVGSRGDELASGAQTATDDVAMLFVTILQRLQISQAGQEVFVKGWLVQLCSSGIGVVVIIVAGSAAFTAASSSAATAAAAAAAATVVDPVVDEDEADVHDVLEGEVVEPLLGHLEAEAGGEDQRGVLLGQGLGKAELLPDVADVVAGHLLDGLEDPLDVVVLPAGRPQLDLGLGLVANFVQILAQPRAQLLAHNLPTEGAVQRIIRLDQFGSRVTVHQLELRETVSAITSRIDPGCGVCPADGIAARAAQNDVFHHGEEAVVVVDVGDQHVVGKFGKLLLQAVQVDEGDGLVGREPVQPQLVDVPIDQGEVTRKNVQFAHL